MITPVRLLVFAIIVIGGTLFAADGDATATKPTQQFVTVEENVKLEVVDWGGSGRPLVLLAGLGFDIHVFDQFAPKLAPKYHVYGITRRGFGASSVPETGYSSERLGEDVIAVLNELKIERPILVGWSIAGSELSYVGSVRSEKVTALIYLEAAYAYAFYFEGTSQLDNAQINSIELIKKLEQMPSTDFWSMKQFNEELLASVQRFEKDLLDQRELLKDMPEPPKSVNGDLPASPPKAIALVMGGIRKYKDIQVPALAIYAVRSPGSKELEPLPKAAAEKLIASVAVQAEAVEKGVPLAHVVRIPNATHGIFASNEAEVLREMEQFIGALPPSKAN